MASMSCAARICMRSFLQKPKRVFLAEEKEEKLERNLSLWDLIAIGVGGTVGSGVFVLTGVIASEYAGPGAVFSWIIAGVCCLFSAVSYAELSCRTPSAGSSYTYVYHSLGELPAVIAAWCLTLEYGISGAAVARSWGDKLIIWSHSINLPIWDSGHGINVYAGVLQALCCLLLMMGLEMSKLTVNIFSSLKVALVVFMIVAGLALFNPGNVSDWTPYGYTGVMRGATAAFFGYVGYDEVCCLAAEAKDPHRTLPLAVFGTIGIVTLLYVFSALSLVGMASFEGTAHYGTNFSEAFSARGWEWAAQVVAIGELITLPLVVLVSFLAQPRLQFAMAEDGLLPKIFGVLDDHGNLYWSIVISGVLCTLIALFVPFGNLDDMVSAGVLISFNLTNTSLIMTRAAREPPSSPHISNGVVRHTNKFDAEIDVSESRKSEEGSDSSLDAVSPIADLSEDAVRSYQLGGRQKKKHSSVQSAAVESSSARGNSLVGVQPDDLQVNGSSTKPLDGNFSMGLVSLVSFTEYACACSSLKSEDIDRGPYACSRYFTIRHVLALYHIVSISLSFVLMAMDLSSAYIIFPVILALLLLAASICIHSFCEEPVHDVSQEALYRVPFVPYTPLIGIFVNYYLIAQLTGLGIALVVLYILTAVIFYYSFGFHFSVGNNSGWRDVLKSVERHSSDEDIDHHRAGMEHSSSFSGYSNECCFEVDESSSSGGPSSDSTLPIRYSILNHSSTQTRGDEPDDRFLGPATEDFNDISVSIKECYNPVQRKRNGTAGSDYTMLNYS